MMAGHTLDQWLAGLWGALFLGVEVAYVVRRVVRNRVRRGPRH